MARLNQKPPTSRVPHHKSKNARLAEGRGEGVWTSWTQKRLIDEVMRLNYGVTAVDLRRVGPLEYLRVLLLQPTEQHHTALRMQAPHNSRQTQYYRVDPRLAHKLKPTDIQRWQANKPDDEELDRMVFDKTGKVYYRKR